MKLKLKKSYVVAIIVILGTTLVVWKLDKNKKLNAKETHLANASATFFPVKVDTVEYTAFQGMIEVSGVIESGRDLIVLSEIQGEIVRVFKQKGDYVYKGDVIAKIDDHVLKAQLELSKANLEAAGRDLQRLKKLESQEAVAKKDFEDIELKYQKAKSDYILAKRKVEDTEIKSPVNGYINDDYIDLGMFITGGTKICNVINPMDLKVNIYLSDKEINQLANSSEIIVQSDVYPDERFKATVSNIAQKASENNLFKTEISINENNKKLLLAGMYVTVNIKLPEENTILIARQSIDGSLKDASVFTVKNDFVTKNKVVVSGTAGEMVCIQAGLEKGDVIVTSGTLNLYDKAQVKILH